MTTAVLSAPRTDPATLPTHARAVVFDEPGRLAVRELALATPGVADVLVAPGARAIPVGDTLQAESVLLALGATAMHAVRDGDAPLPDLIVGHGALGRLAARLVCALGGPAPTVWEIDPARVAGACGYAVVRPEDDPRRDYGRVLEVSGADGVLDTLIGRLRPGGEIVVAGFYTTPLAFQFVPAFLRGLRLRVAAEWRPEDLRAVCALASDGRLALDGLITHRANVSDAGAAYATAFGDPACIKMVIDWRNPA